MLGSTVCLCSAAVAAATRKQQEARSGEPQQPQPQQCSASFHLGPARSNRIRSACDLSADRQQCTFKMKCFFSNHLPLRFIHHTSCSESPERREFAAAASTECVAASSETGMLSTPMASPGLLAVTLIDATGGVRPAASAPPPASSSGAAAAIVVR